MVVLFKCGTSVNQEGGGFLLGALVQSVHPEPLSRGINYHRSAFGCMSKLW